MDFLILLDLDSSSSVAEDDDSYEKATEPVREREQEKKSIE